MIYIVLLLSGLSFVQMKNKPLLNETVLPEKSLLIDQLKNNEFYTIEFYSKGCFHSFKKSVRISRVNNIYYAKHLDKLVILSNLQKEIVRKFEFELTKMQDGFCTTRDIYTLTYNGIESRYVDGSCQWQDGGYNFISMLFPKE